jgi:hypothetical protein
MGNIESGVQGWKKWDIQNLSSIMHGLHYVVPQTTKVRDAGVAKIVMQFMTFPLHDLKVQSKGAKILAVVFFLKTPIPTIKLNYS